MPDFQPPSVDISVVIQLVIVFGWAIVLLIIDLSVPRNHKRITGYIALAGVIVAAAVGVPLLRSNSGMTLTFANMIGLDNYALTLNWIFLAIAAITILISLDYLRR